MGYIWQYTRNVIVDGLVHVAMRDIKPEAERGQVALTCRPMIFFSTKSKPANRPRARYTTKGATCLACLGAR